MDQLYASSCRRRLVIARGRLVDRLAVGQRMDKNGYMGWVLADDP